MTLHLYGFFIHIKSSHTPNLGCSCGAPSTLERIVLHPKSIPRLAEIGDRTMGCRTSASPLIRSVRHHDYSVYPSVPEFRSPTFHVSDLHFVSRFRSYLHFPFHSIFDPWPWTPTLTYARFSLPWYVLFGTYTFRSSCMFLSLKLTLIVPRTHRPNLWTFVCLSPEIRGQ